MSRDPLITSPVSPGITRQEIVGIALANIGISWTIDGCTDFVWGVTNLAGAPFFDLRDMTIGGDPALPQDDLYAVPHSPGIASSTDDIPGDGWTAEYSGTSASEMAAILQPGDVVRVYANGNASESSGDVSSGYLAHSFVVVSVDGGDIQVVDNWNIAGIIQHSLDDIVSAFAPTGTFASAFVSRLDEDYVANNFDTDLAGNGFGDFSGLDEESPGSGFYIRFDYSLDATGFFDDPERIAVLEEAARIWATLIEDDFASVPAGVTFSINNPSNIGSPVSITTTEEINDLLIFVGADDLGGFRSEDGTLVITGGNASVGGYDAAGDVLRSRIYSEFRGEPTTDFEPWVGSITFNSNPDANYSTDLDAPQSGMIDLLSTALHEIAHILGFGSSGPFEGWTSPDGFEGPNALTANLGNPIPLEADGSHIADGFAGNSVLMDPLNFIGIRRLPSEFDIAILADIGYEIAGTTKVGSLPDITTPGDDATVFGTIVDDVIDGLEGNDQLQGNDGADILIGGPGNDILFGQLGDDQIFGGADDDELHGNEGNDTLEGGSGNDIYVGSSGADTYRFQGAIDQDQIVGFDFSTDVLEISRLFGFNTVDEVLVQQSRPFTNVTRLSLADDEWIDLFDNASGTALTEANIRLMDPVISWDQFIANIGASPEDELALIEADFLRILWDSDEAEDVFDSFYFGQLIMPGGNLLNDFQNWYDEENGTGPISTILDELSQAIENGQLTFIDGQRLDVASFFDTGVNLPNALSEDSFEFADIRQVALVHFARNLLNQPITYEEVLVEGQDYVWLEQSKNAFHRIDIHPYLDNIDNFKVVSEDGGREYIFRHFDGQFELVTDPLNAGSYNFVAAGPSLIDFKNLSNGFLDQASEDHAIFDIRPWQAFGNNILDPSEVGDRGILGGRDENLPEALEPAAAQVLGTTGDDPAVQGEVDAEGNFRLYEIFGLAGNDTLISGPQEDELYGGPDFDLASYANSDDAVVANLSLNFARHGYASRDNTPELLIGIEGLIGSSFGDILIGDDFSNEIRGGAGNDIIRGEGSEDSMYGGSGNDTMRGGEQSDLMRGGGDADLMDGGDGNDILIAEDGDDSVLGGNGDDFAKGGAGSDTLEGGEGEDTLVGQSGSDRLYGGGGRDELFANIGVDTLDGGAGNDLMYGQAGADSLDGGIGRDQMFGNLGSDTLNGGADDDRLYGQAGPDQLFGHGGADQLFGSGGNDSLDGGGENDTLDGGNGRDTLIGGLGNDLLTGSFNGDSFVFANSHGNDQVVDFDANSGGAEVIDLSGITFAPGITDYTTLEASGAVTTLIGGVQIDTGGGNSILLSNVLFGDLDNADFLI